MGIARTCDRSKVFLFIVSEKREGGVPIFLLLQPVSAELDHASGVPTPPPPQQQNGGEDLQGSIRPSGQGRTSALGAGGSPSAGPPAPGAEEEAGPKRSLSQTSDDFLDPSTAPICDEVLQFALPPSKISAPGKPEEALNDHRILIAHDLSLSWFTAFTNISNPRSSLPLHDQTMSEYPERRRDVSRGHQYAAFPPRRGRFPSSSYSRYSHASRHQRLRYPIPAGDFVPTSSPLVQSATLSTAAEASTTVANFPIGCVPGVRNVYGNYSGDRVSRGFVSAPPGLHMNVPGGRGQVLGIQGFVPGAHGFTPGVHGFTPGVRGFTPGVRDFVTGVRGFVAGVRDSVAGVRDSVAGVRDSVSGVRDTVPGDRVYISAPQVSKDTSDESPAQTFNDAVSDTSNDAPSEAPSDALSESAVDIPGEAPAPIAPAWFFTEKVVHTKDIWVHNRVGDRRFTDWPSLEEMSEAGDERALRHKARMLHIPRYHNVDARYDSGYGMNGTSSSAVAAGTAQVPHLFRKYAVDLTGPKNRYPIPCDPSDEENARRDPRQTRRQRQQEQALEQSWDADIEQQFDTLLGDNN
ncbi:hypothetical protein PG996_003331 [Apiospora saccharicola]|uniref:Uncharacterized protein n=1 Tax=Apiospora saccharicola TaxID=335842 RepID=A0ABR1W0Y8_9PEZI